MDGRKLLAAIFAAFLAGLAIGLVVGAAWMTSRSGNAEEAVGAQGRFEQLHWLAQV